MEIEFGCWRYGGLLAGVSGFSLMMGLNRSEIHDPENGSKYFTAVFKIVAFCSWRRPIRWPNIIVELKSDDGLRQDGRLAFVGGVKMR